MFLRERFAVASASKSSPRRLKPSSCNLSYGAPEGAPLPRTQLLFPTQLLSYTRPPFPTQLLFPSSNPFLGDAPFEVWLNIPPDRRL